MRELALPLGAALVVAVLVAWGTCRMWLRGHRLWLVLTAFYVITFAGVLGTYGVNQPGWMAGFGKFLIALGIGFGPGLGLVAGIGLGMVLTWRRNHRPGA